MVQPTQGLRDDMTTGIAKKTTRTPRITSTRQKRISSQPRDDGDDQLVDAQNAELTRLMAKIDAGLDEIDRINGRSTSWAA